MPRLFTPEEGLRRANQAAQKRGGRLVSTVWHGAGAGGHHYEWECRKGHRWLAGYYNIVHQDHWCHTCVGGIRQSPQAAIERAAEAAAKRGGRFLSSSYTSVGRKYLWQCAKGHRWSAAYSSVVNAGHWCARCYNATSERYNSLGPDIGLQRAADYAKSKGGVFPAQKWAGTRGKYQWKCAKGHAWKACYNIVTSGWQSWCPRCAKAGTGNRLRKPIEDVKAELRSMRCVVKDREFRYKRAGARLTGVYHWDGSKAQTSLCNLRRQFRASGLTKTPHAQNSGEQVWLNFVDHFISGDSALMRARPDWLIASRSGRRKELDGLDERHGFAWEYDGEPWHPSYPTFKAKRCVEKGLRFKRFRQSVYRNGRIGAAIEFAKIKFPSTPGFVRGRLKALQELEDEGLLNDKFWEWLDRRGVTQPVHHRQKSLLKRLLDGDLPEKGDPDHGALITACAQGLHHNRRIANLARKLGRGVHRSREVVEQGMAFLLTMPNLLGGYAPSAASKGAKLYGPPGDLRTESEWASALNNCRQRYRHFAREWSRLKVRDGNKKEALRESRIAAMGRPVRCIETGAIYPSQAAAARALGVLPSSMVEVIKNPEATIGGGPHNRLGTGLHFRLVLAEVDSCSKMRLTAKAA